MTCGNPEDLIRLNPSLWRRSKAGRLGVLDRLLDASPAHVTASQHACISRLELSKKYWHDKSSRVLARDEVQVSTQPDFGCRDRPLHKRSVPLLLLASVKVCFCNNCLMRSDLLR